MDNNTLERVNFLSADIMYKKLFGLDYPQMLALGLKHPDYGRGKEVGLHDGKDPIECLRDCLSSDAIKAITSCESTLTVMLIKHVFGHSLSEQQLSHLIEYTLTECCKHALKELGIQSGHYMKDIWIKEGQWDEMISVYKVIGIELSNED